MNVIKNSINLHNFTRLKKQLTNAMFHYQIGYVKHRQMFPQRTKKV